MSEVTDIFASKQSSKALFDSSRFDVDQCLNSLERQGAKIDQHIYELLTTNHDLKTEEIIQSILDRTTLHRKQIYRSFADAFGLPFVDMDWISANTDLLPMIPAEKWKENRAFPLSKIGGIMEIAFADPFNVKLAMYFEEKHGLKVSRMFAVPDQIDAYLETEFVDTHEVQQAFSQVSSDALKLIGDQVDRGDTHGVVPFGEMVITLAKKYKASDIHIEAMENDGRIRMRIDGRLKEILSISSKLCHALVTFFKVTGNLDISEKRLPQDGRISGQLGHADIDLRLSTVPSVHGEKMCIRMLDQSVTSLNLETLSFSKRLLPPFRRCLNSPHGLFLVTGPTGSGKTTTLYAALSDIADPSLNITTIEDPVEYTLGGINQIQVHSKINLDFPTVLRAVLRQDPDIILIGEIRDGETAQIAIKAALTGHLVLSTLHTNTAPDAVVRLIDMGVPAYLIGQALLGVMGQRLVKRLCPHCRVEKPLNAEQKQQLSLHPSHELSAYEAVGCKECSLTGYKGRLPVQELLVVDDKINQALAHNKPLIEWHQHAIDNGYRPISYDALIKALGGLTTIDEVIRVHSN